MLAECGAEVHLAHSLGNNWGHPRVKNDKRDATDLVDLLRMGRLAEAWPLVVGGQLLDPREELNDELCVVETGDLVGVHRRAHGLWRPAAVGFNGR